KKLQNGQFDAILLAMAGLKRSALFDSEAMHPLDADRMLPAAGQGALALQCRADDPATRGLAAALDDPDTRLCVDAERRLVQLLGGDCHSPIAALARIQSGRLGLQAAVGSRNGGLPLLRAHATVDVVDAEKAVAQVNDYLQKQGANSILGDG